MKEAKKNEKNLVKNASLNVLKQVCTLAFSLITFPYVSRTLGDDSYGKYSFASSIVEYLLIFSSSAGGAYAIREGARVKNNPAKIKELSSELFTISCLFTFVAYIALFMLITFWNKLHEYQDLLCIMSLRLLATTIGVDWIFNIYEDFKNITIRQIVVQGLGLLLTMLLVHSSDDVNLYAVATIVAMSGANIFNFFISRKYVKFRLTTSLNLSTHLKPIIMILFYSAMITIYSNADIIMLGVMKNDSVVGAYSVAAKIYGIAKNIFIAALTVLLPRMSNYLGNNEFSKMKIAINTTLDILLIGLSPVIVLLVFYAKPTILLVAGKDYLKGTAALQLLSIALLFAVVSSLLTTNVMIPNRQESKITIIVTISALSNIVLNYFFIPMWGAAAAALTTIVAEMVVCIGAIIYSAKYIEFRRTIIVLLKSGVSSLLMLVLLLAVSTFNLMGIFEIVIGGLVSCSAYVLSFLFLTRRYWRHRH